MQRLGLSTEIYGDRMESFLTAFLEKVPLIFLIASLPMELGTWILDEHLSEESRRLESCYLDLDRRLSIHFADAGAWDVELAYDGAHFSERRHQSFFSHLLKILAAMFPDMK